MSQKKRGLGRGLGALIPQGPPQEKPLDVYFSGSEPRDDDGAVLTAPARVDEVETSSADSASTDSKSSRRSASWDSAIAGGRLSINGGPARSGTEADAERSVDPIIELAGLASRLESEAVELDTIEELGSISVVTVDRSGSADSATSVSSTAVDEDVPPTEATDAGSPAVVTDSPTDDLLPVPGAHFAEIPLDHIRPNARQPRTVFDESDLDELIASISEIGVLQPIVVRPDSQAGEGYELIMGERRWRAAQQAGLTAIPAIVRETEDSLMLRDALLENLHRAALNPLEEAAAYRQLLDDFGCTHEELATRIARSRPQISNTLRLLKLPPLVQRRVAAGVLSAGHARALLGLTDGAEVERLAQRIVSEGLSVRATEEIVTLLVEGGAEKPQRRAPRAGQRSEAMNELATRLSDRFETRVKVNIGKTKGRMTVEFASVDDLNRILEVMAPEDPGLLKP